MISILVPLLSLLASCSHVLASPTHQFINTTIPLTLCNVTETGSKKLGAHLFEDDDDNPGPFAECVALYAQYSTDNGYLNLMVADAADAGWAYVVAPNKTCAYGLEVAMDVYPGSVQIGNKDIALMLDNLLLSQTGANPVWQISGHMVCDGTQAVNWTVIAAPDIPAVV